MNRILKTIALFYIFLFAFFICLVGCSIQEYKDLSFGQKVKRGYSVNVLINGDSISSGNEASDWPILVANQLKEEYELPIVNISNLSLPGNTSIAGYARIHSADLDNKGNCDLIILCYGQNDLEDSFSTNYEALVRATISRYPNAQIVCILESSQKAYTNKIEQIKEICDSYKIPYVDTIAKFQEFSGDYGSLTYDGIHPNEQGNILYADAVLDVIRTEIVQKNKKPVLLKDPLNEECKYYQYCCYIPASLMNKVGNEYNIEIPDSFDSIILDRAMLSGQHSQKILLENDSIDCSYEWKGTPRTRIIESVRVKEFDPQTIRILGDEEALEAVNGIIVTSRYQFTMESAFEDFSVINVNTNTLQVYDKIETAILNSNAEIQMPLNEEDEIKNYTVFVYQVTPGSFLNLESTTIGPTNQITRYAFFDGNHRVVKASCVNLGGWSDKYSSCVEVPENATYLYVTCQNGQTPTVYKVQKQTTSEEIGPVNAIPESLIDASGLILSNTETSKNYTIYIYEIDGTDEVKITTNSYGNKNTIMKYGFSNDLNVVAMEKKGKLNSKGWEDTEDSMCRIPSKMKYLFATCQNGEKPIVIGYNLVQ